MKSWRIESRMNYKENDRGSFINGLWSFIIAFIMIVIFLIGIIAFICSLRDCSANTIERSNSQWGGYYPGIIYQVYDKDTGVYYAITEQGGITPMYTIEGEVKLVDQGNEYVVHKNLGEPTVSED